MAPNSFSDLISLLVFYNFDLLSVGLAVAAIGILGYTVYRHNTGSTTNRTLFVVSVFASLWGVANYLSYQIHSSHNISLWLLRAVLFFAVWFCFYIYKLMYVFPLEVVKLPSWFTYYLRAFVGFVSVLVLSPYVFKRIINISPIGVPHAELGAGIAIFGITVFSLVIASWYALVRKIFLADKSVRNRYLPVLYGTIVTFSFLIAFNFILPAFVGDLRFIPFGGIYILPFVGFTAYAIVRYGLFDLKIIATESFVIIITLLYIGKVLISPSPRERIIDGVILVASAFFGILLVRSIKQEVRAREEVRLLAQRLSETNWELARINEQLRVIDQRKSEFVSIVSHQLRTPITALKGYSSLLLENTFGELTSKQKVPVEKIFISSTRLADMVTDFLDISKIEQGKMSYNFVSVDVRAMLIDLIEEFAPIAKQKDIVLSSNFEKIPAYIVTADEGKLRQILSNVLDNSVKYTPHGSVQISLEKDNTKGAIILKVKDSGIGLSQDDIHHLFGKFTRGSGGQRENTDGSGLGLYVAMKMLDAMHGKIWVDSEGQNKGSTFVIELLAEEEG